MFTGLIKTVAKVLSTKPRGSGKEIAVELSGLTDYTLRQGASVAINGVCLTITGFTKKTAFFEAIDETLKHSTLNKIKSGDLVNIEPALKVGDPLDGHLVQGHIDEVGKLLSLQQLSGSKILQFSISASLAPLVATKGSIAINGVSLTIVEARNNNFSVALIPETLHQTNLGELKVGSEVNIEADVIARYLNRQQQYRQNKQPLTRQRLSELGYL